MDWNYAGDLTANVYSSACSATCAEHVHNWLHGEENPWQSKGLENHLRDEFPGGLVRAYVLCDKDSVLARRLHLKDVFECVFVQQLKFVPILNDSCKPHRL